MTKQKQRITSIVCNLFIGIVSFSTWLYMNLAGSADNLTSRGIESLKYFTTLSNLFNGAVALWFASLLIRKRKISSKNKAVKLTSTAAVGLTFVTVLVFLGPLYGYPMMFTGANFWLHLVLPVLSFITYIFFDEGKTKFKDSFFAFIPPVLYSIGYVGNICINGIGDWPNKNDFYSFFNWGVPVGMLIAIIIPVSTWLIALCLHKLANLKKSAK